MDVKCIGSGKETICHFDITEFIPMLHSGYKKFADHYKLLAKAGVIIKTKTGNYNWTFSKISLTEYFIYITDGQEANMAWQALENIFNYKHGTLRRLASAIKKGNNARSPGKKSKGFERILEIIAPK